MLLGAVGDRLLKPLVQALETTPSTRHMVCTLKRPRCALMNSYAARGRARSSVSWTSVPASVVAHP
jgi:hypothetical protein